MSTERRQFARVAFDAKAHLTTTSERLAVRVIDLSLKGALLQLPERGSLKPGDPCLLSVELAELEAGISMAGEVAHMELDGKRVGMLCRSIDIESITHLRRLLEINLGDAHLLERELKALIASN